jgi:hypothetical protein
MAHLPMDDARILFNDTKQKNWSSFHQVLRQHKGTSDGISDNLIDMMMPISEHMQQSNKPFPSSPQELDNVLNDELAKMPAH